jgi:hypothetical protein
MRLTGARRDAVMKLYLAAKINAHEAARLIGVNVRTIPRIAPEWFNWRVRRDAYLAAIAAKLQKMEADSE